MTKEKIKKIAGIAAVVLAVGSGAYLTGAKGLGTCDAKAKARSAAMTSQGTCEKVHASAMASADGSCEAKTKNTAMTTASTVKADDRYASEATTAAMASSTCDAKVKNAVLTDADACPYMKAQAAKTAVASAQEGDCSEGACPMEKGAKGGASKKVDHQKAAPKRTMASVVPAAETTK